MAALLVTLNYLRLGEIMPALLVTLSNLTFITLTVGLGAFVFGQARGHRPALWLLGYSTALSFVDITVVLTPYATDRAGGLVLESLRCIFLTALSYALLHLFAALFAPEWWEGRRPIRWIGLVYLLFGLFTLVDLTFGLGLVSDGIVEQDGLFSAGTAGPLGPITIGIYLMSWLVHLGICLVTFIRRPALRAPILILGGGFAVTLVGGVLVSQVLNLPELGVLMGLPVIGAMAQVVFRSRLFVTSAIATSMALQAMGDAVVVVEGEDRVGYANPAAEALQVRPGASIRASLGAAGVSADALSALGRQIAAGDHADLTITLRGRRFAIDWATVRDPRGRPVGTLFLGRDVTELEQRNAELAGERARLEGLVRELAEEQAQRSQLTSIVRALSLPVIPVLEGVLVLPLVGDFDAARGAEFTGVLLQAIERERAHTALIDITGMTMIDTADVAVLLRAVEAARLLGARCVLVGVRPEIAQSIVSLGVTLDNLPTAATLQQVIANINHHRQLR